jgi:hypothetical protein
VPFFSAQLSNLQTLGPIVDVQLSPGWQALQAMQSTGTPLPVPITVAAMMDTGAAASVVQAGLAQQLGLQPIGAQLINTASTQGVLCYQYVIHMTLPTTGHTSLPIHFELPFLEAPLKAQRIQCLLGRDFLAHGVFVYSGPTNTFLFSV